jgi:hypothetical protein
LRAEEIYCTRKIKKKEKEVLDSLSVMPPYTRLALLIALLSPILGKIRFPHFSSISSLFPPFG